MHDANARPARSDDVFLLASLVFAAAIIGWVTIRPDLPLPL